MVNLLYEIEKTGIKPLDDSGESLDSDLDAVGRASDLVLEAKTRDLTAQRLAMTRLVEVIANDPAALEKLEKIQGGE